jgi:Fur family ferric uptake transcriptional regulator
MIDDAALIQRVRGLGFKMTHQRAAILRALCGLDGHASVERVYERVQQQHRDLDLSTVYRTLERLRDLHVVSQTDLGRGCAEFEIVTDRPHHHLLCQGCGRVIDMDHSYLAPVGRAIREDLGFDAVFSHFAIFGLCRQCRPKGETPERQVNPL